MVAKTAEFNYSVLLDHDPGHQYAGPQNPAKKILWFTYKSTTWVGSQTDISGPTTHEDSTRTTKAISICI